MATFLGANLSLQSVTVRNNGMVLRVRFSNDPRQTDSSGANDALNVANYTLSGPGIANMSVATPVGSDPQSIDITLVSRIPSGTWTMTVANIEMVIGEPLSAPTSVQFIVSSALTPRPVNPGSENDGAAEIIRKHLNPALRGDGWDSLIAALATGDTYNNNNTESAFNQLYKSTADSKYLDRLTSNDGVVRPRNVGLSDTLYRKLAIALNSNKVVDQAILEVLRVYYGEDAVRANVQTEEYAPFALTDGDDLNVTIDGASITKIVFNTNEFSQIGAATATEVAAAITRAFVMNNSRAFAVEYVDPADGESKVKIYTPSLGLKGSVQVKGSGGGKAQNALKFNTFIDPYTGTITP